MPILGPKKKRNINWEGGLPCKDPWLQIRASEVSKEGEAMEYGYEQEGDGFFFLFIHIYIYFFISKKLKKKRKKEVDPPLSS